MTTIYTHPECFGHDPGKGHPESPKRLEKVIDALKALPQDINVRWDENPPLGSDEQILRAHDNAYFAFIKETAAKLDGTKELINTDIDTMMSDGSYAAALRGVGAACQAVEDVYQGKAKNAFCATRPPGHHALNDASMGFCIFGNAAIAAHHALTLEGIEKVVIIDFDVHQGNGTQDLIGDEPRITLFSTHQKDLWPYEGKEEDRGRGGNARNFEIPIQSDPKIYHDVFKHKIFKEIQEIEPDFFIISAGFDAHRDDAPKDQLLNDPPGRQMLLEEDFDWMTRGILTLADKYAKGRVVSIMEGGYNVDVLASCCASHVKTLVKA
ncbi:MAG: histone deacetylase family protein [Micavibrio sp.]|nr:histone deacetylase family protein [Micavibrio sp.]